MAKRRLKFLPDGRDRVMRAAEYAAVRRRVVAEVRADYSAELGGPNVFGRIVAWFKVRREVNRRLERVAPTRGLYMKVP
jgi:hypothetical protein